MIFCKIYLIFLVAYNSLQICLIRMNGSGSDKRRAVADPVQNFHDFPVNRLLVKAVHFYPILANHDNIGLDRDIMLVQPEAFSYQSFDPVALHRRTDFSGCGNSQPPIGEITCPDKNDKAGREIATAPGITFLKKGPFGYP